MRSPHITLPLVLAAQLVAAGCSSAPTAPPSLSRAPPRITAFDVDRAVITADAGALVRLSFAVEGAARVSVQAGARRLVDAACVPTDLSAGCAAGGAFIDRPQTSTAYVLVAAATADADCALNDDGAPRDGDSCAVASISVEAREPATITLSPSEAVVQPGASVRIDYATTAAKTFQLGVVTLADGVRDFTPCAFGEDDDDAPCRIAFVDGRPAAQGTVTFADVATSFTVGAIADNGADDGLGRVGPGDVEARVSIAGAPSVRSFAAADRTLAPGARAELALLIDATNTVELVAQPAEAVSAADVAACVVDALGVGACSVELAGAAQGRVLLTLVARDADGARSAPATVALQIGAPPTGTLSADVGLVPATGGDVELVWATENATTVRIIDDEGATVVAAEDMDALRGSVTLHDVARTTTWTLLADNDYGRAAVTTNVDVAGTPRITAVSLDGEDALARPLVTDGDAVALAWTTADASSVELARAPVPAAGCADPDAAWSDDVDFAAASSAGAGQSIVGGIDASVCLRLTARGGAGQSDVALLQVVRRPVIEQLVADDATRAPGDTVRVSWIARHAQRVYLLASPAGAVAEGDLAACAAVDPTSGEGGCDVPLQAGAQLGDVVFTAVAHGLADSASAPTSMTITLGTAPALGSFTADRTALDEAGDVLLAWSTAHAARVEITDDLGATVLVTEDGEVVAAGQLTMTAVARTTTFTLSAESVYGAAVGQVTVFYGPSIDVLTVNGEDALDGATLQPTGDAAIAWSASNADTSTLQRAPLPGTGDCADVAAWSDAATSSSAGATTLALDRDACLRLTVANGAGQSSALVVHVAEAPITAAPRTDRASIGRSAGGDVVVSFDVAGASQVDVVAQYLNAQGGVVSSANVCDEGSLESGALSSSSSSSALTCRHHATAWTCLLDVCTPQLGSIPTGTTAIRYVTTARDEEGDTVTATSADVVVD